MYSNMIFAVVIVLAGAIWWLIHFHSAKKPGHRAVPGPIGLPIIGHLHLLGNLPHRSLYKLSQKYGPIMSLRLGPVPTIVVSSPAAATLILKTHDKIFASRPEFVTSKYLPNGTKGITFTKYSAYWQSMKKLVATELLSKARIKSMARQRIEEIGLLVRSLEKSAATGEVVNLSQKLGELIEDMTYRMLFGKTKVERSELSHIVHEITGLVGSFNIADLFPFLARLDLQGLTRRLKVASQEAEKILESIIDDHEQNAGDIEEDLTAVLLSLQKKHTSTDEHLSHELERSDIKAIVFDILFGAIDTSQTTIEWVMLELLRHPRVMKLVQEEIKNVAGDCELLEESVLPKLEYLDMVVKESLRLHPTAPLSIPHESIEDIVIDGYCIPKKTRILISIWGLGRDPKVWSENVDEFYPERFIDNNIDYRGKEFHLIQFGFGRRSCPGMYLGLTNVKLVVAQLVHSFNWELPFGLRPNELDIKETSSPPLLKSSHVLAMPTSRAP